MPAQGIGYPIDRKMFALDDGNKCKLRTANARLVSAKLKPVLAAIRTATKNRTKQKTPKKTKTEITS